jgi:lipoprotein signal peptidase
MRLRRRALLNVGVLLLSVVVASRVARQFGEIPVLAIRLCLRPAGIFFWVTLWRLLAPGPWKVAVTFFAGSMLANGLSEALPPFGVVTDFIHSSAYSHGTFNLADAYQYVGRVLLVVAAVASLFRWIKLRRSRRG